MLAVAAGIVLIIDAILLWVGNISPDHAVALFIGVIGVLLLVWWAVPNGWARRA